MSEKNSRFFLISMEISKNTFEEIRKTILKKKHKQIFLKKKIETLLITLLSSYRYFRPVLSFRLRNGTANFVAIFFALLVQLQRNNLQNPDFRTE